MIKKTFALALLSLSLAACEPSSTDNNSNASSNAKANTPVAATPAPAAPSAEPGASVKPQLKAGDKVKVTINGVVADANVVRVDEKAGRVTVRIQGQKEEKTVAIGEIVRE